MMMGEDFGQIALTASTWILPILFAITFHEAAHAYVAWYYGDNTAYEKGRVTLNPLSHIDPFGTVILPALLLISPAPFIFGWAKPVPVAGHRLTRPRRDMVLVAAAGPVMNLLLAFTAAILLHVARLLPGSFGEWLMLNLFNAITINLILAIFNMIPLPPLDGGRVAVGLLPDRLAYPLARLERYGLFILIGAMFLLPWLGSRVGLDLNFFYWLVVWPFEKLFPLFAALGGV
jgi:Zn-dependent protease